MYNGFEKSAMTYDTTFTYSSIGKCLRSRVHKYLDRALQPEMKLRILELNCGTGEDALYFALKGHGVTATDSSLQMLDAAKRKALNKSTELNLKFEQLNLNELDKFRFNDTYDLVFSDFGGLNCISPEELKTLSISIKKILSDKGRFIAVVMSRFCQWEILYFLLKGKLNKSFRRSGRGAVDVNMNGEVIKTYYYTPYVLKKIFEPEFSIINKVPIGLFLPPTYMESFFKRRKTLLAFLNTLESISGRWNYLALLGDHFLIDMKVKR